MNTAKVLVCEDERIVAREIQDRLIKLGYTVTAIVSSGEQAIQKAAELAPDLVLMDIRIKGDMDGIETTREIQNAFDIPVIYLTAYADENTLERAKITEPFGYILKPFKEKELHATIEIALSKHRMERKLKEREQWLTTVLKSIGDAVISSDINGKVTFMNFVAEALTGWKQEEVLGRDATEIFTIVNEQTRFLIENPLTKVLQSGVVLALPEQAILIARNGTEIVIDDTTSPLKDDKGNITGAVWVFRDITFAKQQEKALRESEARVLATERQARADAEAANRIKDEFLAVLSHELRSPLNPILGWTKLLLSRKFDQAKTAKALETIERNAVLQSQLIEDLLDVSGILQGKLSLNPCPVDLAVTIKAATETVRLAAQAKSICLNTLLEPTVGQVSGDSSRLQQIVWNLLSNAVKFTPTGGRVDIRLESIGGQAMITVSDTGKGIKPEFLPYVFDYFRQADSTTTRTYGGLGLGLAIVRHLVELHGGTVKAESPGEGKGATFTVTLPLMKVVPAKGEDNISSDDSPNLDGLRILVVDDEKDTLELIVFILEGCGASVRAASSAAEALEALTTWQPDILLSDIGMPQMDGYMLMRQIRAMPPEQGGEIPAIALTAYAGETDQRQVLKAGFQKHLTKPIDPADLAVVIASFTGRNRNIAHC